MVESRNSHDRVAGRFGDTYVRPQTRSGGSDSATRAETFAVACDPIINRAYEVLEPIGSGGMGTIYKARHRILKRIVAIKVIRSAHLTEDSVRRFQTEGQAIGLLDDPGIVSVHHLDVTEAGQPFMVMDYVEGTTLADWLKFKGTLTPREFVTIFSAVCAALEHAHDRKVLHRDIKPSNIMLIDDGTAEMGVRIMDFGIAKIIEENDFCAQSLTKTGEAVGSPFYMSPEQGHGRQIDLRTDIYSLGCTMYEAMTGAPPFIGKTAYETMAMHMNEEAPAMSEASLGRPVDPAIEALIRRCLEKDPANRFQSMKEVRTALGQVHAPQRRSRSIQPPSKDTLKKTAIVAAAILAMGGIGWMCTSFFKPDSITSDLKSVRPKSAEFKGFNDLVPKLGPSISGQLKGHPDSIDLTVDGDMTEWNKDNLAILRGLPNTVKEINASANNFSNACLAAVSHLPLRKLKLSETQVSDLSPLRGNATLENLNVEKSPVRDAGVKIIATLPKIKNLNLSGAEITDDSLKQLAALKTLRAINISGNNLSIIAVINLQKALPATIIRFKKYTDGDFVREFPLARSAYGLQNSKQSQEALEACNGLLEQLSREKRDDLPLLKSMTLEKKSQVLVSLKRYPEALKTIKDAGKEMSNYYDEGQRKASMLSEEAGMNELPECANPAEALKLRNRLEEQLQRYNGVVSESYVNSNRMINDVQRALDLERLGRLAEANTMMRAALEEMIPLRQDADANQRMALARWETRLNIIGANILLDETLLPGGEPDDRRAALGMLKNAYKSLGAEGFELETNEFINPDPRKKAAQKALYSQAVRLSSTLGRPDAPVAGLE